MAGLKQALVLGGTAFGVVLAVIVGMRLDEAALTAIVGVACGVGASIPTGLLVVLLLRRRDQGVERRAPRGYHPAAAQPPVVVVSPPAAPQLPRPTTWQPSYEAPLAAQREFTVIGEEGIDDGFDRW